MSYTILVVDDSKIIRTMMRKSILMTGVDVGTIGEAGDGFEALSALSAQRFDLIFTDLHMPNMSGEELIQKLTDDPSLCATPVVIVSSEPNAHKIKELIVKGASAFIRKPFTPENLRDVMNQVLTGAK